MKSIFAYLAGQAKRCSLALVVAAAGVLPAAGQTIYGLEFSYGLNNPSLMSFTAANPGTILARTAIAGVANGETLVGLDFRPATSELFGLGYNASTQTGRLYVLNLTTAVATPVGAAVALPLGSGGSPANQGGIAARIGLAFDPATDRIRLSSSTTQANLQLSPTTGSLVATDALFTYATSDAQAGTTASLGTLAYTSTYPGGPAASLYAVDEQTYYLTSIALPTSGSIATVRNLSYTPTTVYSPYPSSNSDLDFYYDPTTGTDIGYLSSSGVDAASGYASLRRLDAAPGSISVTIGPFGGYYEVRDIAVQPAARPLATRPDEMAFSLLLAPNPIVGSTQVAFNLPRAAHIELTVTDALGRVVDVQNAGLRPSGPQTIVWQRRQQGAGFYFFTLRYDGQPVGTRRGVLID